MKETGKTSLKIIVKKIENSREKMANIKQKEVAVIII